MTSESVILRVTQESQKAQRLTGYKGLMHPTPPVMMPQYYSRLAHKNKLLVLPEHEGDAS